MAQEPRSLHFSLKRAGQILGMKYDQLSDAIASGDLAVSGEMEKPTKSGRAGVSGRRQPMVSPKSLEKFRLLLVERYSGMESAWHRRIGKRLDKVEIPGLNVVAAA